MAIVNGIRQILLSELNKRASRRASNMPLVQRQLVVDADYRHFVLMAFGWAKSRYIHQCLIHVELIADKIWIHEDLTDPGIVEALRENGIPSRDIILGYVSELERSEAVGADTVGARSGNSG
jgi:hypothetical protein